MFDVHTSAGGVVLTVVREARRRWIFLGWLLGPVTPPPDRRGE